MRYSGEMLCCIDTLHILNSYSYSVVGTNVALCSTTRIKTRRGIVEHEHERLSPQEAETRLTQHAQSRSFPSGLGTSPKPKPTSVVRFDTNYVECNDPIEDRSASDYLERSKLYAGGEVPEGTDLITEGMKGIKMFSIIDGHSGWACAQLVSQTLHPMILLSLRSLYAGYPPPTTFTHRLAGSNMSTSAHLMEYISSLGSKLSAVVPFLGTSTSGDGGAEVNPTTMKNSIISAFLTLDDQIITSATRLIPHIPTQPGKPNLRPIVQPMLAPAVSGACAINLLVDEEREEVYVSNTGDCRAVAGVWVEPNPKEGKEGGWRCEVLSEDMMGDNPAEVERSVDMTAFLVDISSIAQGWLADQGRCSLRFVLMSYRLRREHPGEDPIKRGRVLGRLQPTRTFGQSIYQIF